MPLARNVSSSGLRALMDSAYRFEKLYKIKDKHKQTVIFRPHRAQQLIEKEIVGLKQKKRPVRLIILKPRQIGCTTYFCIRNFDKTYWNKNQFTAIIAHRSKQIHTIFSEIVKFTYDNLPQQLKFKAYNDSATQLNWRNIASQMLVTNDGHGITPNRFHFTEVGHMANAKEKIGESLQAIPRSGEVVQESTANGDAGYFADSWKQAVDPSEKSVWHPIFLKWWHHYEYQLPVPENFELTEEEKELLASYGKDGLTVENLAWRREKINELGGSKVDVETGLSGYMLFQQNYPMNWHEAFIIRGNSLFDMAAILWMSQNRPVEGEYLCQQWGRGYCRTFRNHVEGLEYFISCDPSFGDAGSYSAATVFEKRSRAIACTLHGKYNTGQLAKNLHNLAKFYNNAMISIERNTGHAVLNELLNHTGYFNIYYHTEYDGTIEKKKPGFPTTAKTRNLMLSDLEDSIADRSLIVPDEHYIGELKAFGNVNGKWQATHGNDDRVLSLAIGNHLCLQSNVSLGMPPMAKPGGM